MKGTIVKCLQELVTERFGAAKWTEALAAAGLPATSTFLTTAVVPDGDVLKLLAATTRVLGITAEQAMDAFGEFWCTKYAPDVYGVYFQKAKNAREFLVNLDHVHVIMTKTAGANPPRFQYEWKGDKHLIIRYASPRNLVQLMPGLVRGVAKYYREKLDVTVDGDDVHVRFAA